MAKTKDRKRIKSNPIQKWINEYNQVYPTYVQFVNKLQKLLTELLEESKIEHLNPLEFRAKDPKSFAEKIQRPDKNYTDPLNELSDLAGLRIIAYYNEDCERIKDLLKKEFIIDSRHSKDKADELATDQFGYKSLHEVITLTKNRKLMTEWRKYKDLHAEVQIRTVLQHAWASISHKLDYKQEIDVPRPIKRKLSLISGLLELADDQFSELRKKRSERGSQMSESINADNLDLPIDSDSLMAYIKEADVIKNLEAEVKRIGFPPVSEKDSTGLSQLVTVCQLLKIETLGDLNRELKRTSSRLGAFFDTFDQNNGSTFRGSTPHWIAVVLVGLDNGNNLKTDEVPWSIAYTEEVFKAGNALLV